ncbi:MAG: putative amidohydrolase [Acidimicrobiia bacterium]|nr:putative amidohydrolase [Acidimicrobiia bacterium]
MTEQGRMLLVSADGHWGGPLSQYVDYIEKAYLDDLLASMALDEAWRASSLSQRRFSEETLDLIDGDGRVRSGGHLGSWDLSRRLAELDREGVAGEIILSGHQDAVLPFFSQTSDPASPAHRDAGVRAYHRQLADVMADADGRLAAIAESGSCTDIEATVLELRWAAAHGFVGVQPPGHVADPGLPPLYDSYYEPFWTACEELDLRLTIHAGYGFPQGMASGMSAMSAMVGAGGTEELLKQATLSADGIGEMRIDQFPRDHGFRTALTLPRRILWQLMLGGVLDRHPRLQLVFTEIRADWVPATLATLEQYFADGHAGLALTPRQYWDRHVWIAPSSMRQGEVAMRHDVGVDRIMFGTDYPHPEGTWPNTQEWIRHAFAGVPEAEARLMLGENTVRCYGLDRARLDAVAQRIGPRYEELLNGEEVDDRLLAQFHSRAGYLRPLEQVDQDYTTELISEDERGLARLS